MMIIAQMPDSIFQVFVTQWGAPGAIIVSLLFAVYWLAKNLIASWKDRLDEKERLLEDKFKADQDMANVLRDLKSSIDASTKMMDLSLQALRSKSP